MDNFRKYGNKPFHVAVIHGGPGAPGEMAPVARNLSKYFSVLEPLQTAKTIAGQVKELKDTLQDHGNPPLTVIGFSWGAWLGCILAARHPSFVKKLILIDSGPFEEEYAAGIMEKRLSRLSPSQQKETMLLMSVINSNAKVKDAIARFGELMAMSDSYDPLPHKNEVLSHNMNIYRNVWEEASKMRKKGELLKLASSIRCPVTAIHGDYDPHPAEGVKIPLANVIKDFRFILLEKCGHRPWLERNVKQEFYSILAKEINGQSTDSFDS